MSEPRSENDTAGGRGFPDRPIALTIWFAVMAIAGLGFGVIGDRRPFGDNILFRPLVMFCCSAAAALLALRIVLQRPVPQVISDRKLAFGFAIGLASFLFGNLLAAHVLR